ncbi:hypothetical protein DVH24_017884 [Malus domestica]|uniref:Uncharacterized protein n=1 Tax=Malus domestica TaxID=3750 RepID=A0A498KJQ3_MALDO|nr:hypothetical protein DVH24_017884 [Malus domestica]
MRLYRTFALLPPSPCPTRITLQKSSHLLGPQIPAGNRTSLYSSLIFLVFCLVAEKIDKEKEKCGLSFAFFYQIAWVRDVTKFRVEGFTRNTSSRRLLKLGLTDGHSESHIPEIPDDVVPGTKVFSTTFTMNLEVLGHDLQIGLFCNDEMNDGSKFQVFLFHKKILNFYIYESKQGN